MNKYLQSCFVQKAQVSLSASWKTDIKNNYHFGSAFDLKTFSFDIATVVNFVGTSHICYYKENIVTIKRSKTTRAE